MEATVETASTRTKVLCVDDEPDELAGSSRVLAPFFDVTIAVGADEALRKMREHGPFPVVLSDLRMPGKDGLEHLDGIRAKAPETVCLLHSGDGDFSSASALPPALVPPMADVPPVPGVLLPPAAVVPPVQGVLLPPTAVMPPVADVPPAPGVLLPPVADVPPVALLAVLSAPPVAPSSDVPPDEDSAPIAPALAAPPRLPGGPGSIRCLDCFVVRGTGKDRPCQEWSKQNWPYRRILHFLSPTGVRAISRALGTDPSTLRGPALSPCATVQKGPGRDSTGFADQLAHESKIPVLRKWMMRPPGQAQSVGCAGVRH